MKLIYYILLLGMLQVSAHTAASAERPCELTVTDWMLLGSQAETVAEVSE